MNNIYKLSIDSEIFETVRTDFDNSLAKTIENMMDKVVEGFEKPDHPYFVAVQWHPERLQAAPGDAKGVEGAKLIEAICRWAEKV